MAIRRRTTEKHPHPIWEKVTKAYNIVEMEGFIFECSDNKLVEATRASSPTIPIHCIESVECDTKEEFNYLSFFDESDWFKKVLTANFFGSSLKLVSHVPKDEHLFRVHEIDIVNGQLVFNEVKQFQNEPAFIEWWKTLKKLSQSKGQVEARPRQGLTIIDGIIEKGGLQWGGNVDGFVLTDSNNRVVAIIELRQSRKKEVELYDPADYFLGTTTKGGDFKTWLPLIYLQKAYNLPLVLITVSTLDETKFGYTEVRGINKSQLFYVNDISPKVNVTSDFGKFELWFNNLISNISTSYK